MIFCKIFEKIIQVIAQNTIPQRAIDVKDANHSKNVPPLILFHSIAIAKTTKNKAKAVQSLNKLSHSKIRVSLLGAHIDLNNAKTATGSVAEIKAQNNKHTINGISNPIKGNKKNNAQAIINAEITSHITARVKIDFQFLTICL